MNGNVANAYTFRVRFAKKQRNQHTRDGGMTYGKYFALTISNSKRDDTHSISLTPFIYYELAATR